MSSWLAALGPCASPKSKAKDQKGGGTLERPANLSSLKRRGSLTEIRNTRKVTGSRSFRERLQDTFDGSLRRAKKAGSLEAVDRTAFTHTFANPDTNMNLATSLSPKSSRNYTKPAGLPFNQDQEAANAVQDKFWTNFYNTLPRNRHKSDRPKDLSLQDLPVTEKQADTEDMLSPSIDMQAESQPSTQIKWQGYATSPRTKRKNKTLERMNSAPSTRKSPMMKSYDGEARAGSDGQVSPQIIESPEQVFDIQGQEFIVMPRSVSLQEDYWVPATKGGSKMELRRVTPSPDRLMIRPSPSGGSPVHIHGGHVWVKSKDGTHMELHPVDRITRDLPSPSDSQKTESSGFSYTTAASSISNLETVPKFPVEDKLPSTHTSVSTQVSSDQPYSGPYMSPEQYQANIFDLIQTLNQSPPNPSSPEFKRTREVKGQQRSPVRSPIDDGRTFHSEKFIVLGNAAAAMQDLEDPDKREQPIFSVRAHVFQIDPDTKKNWLPASKTAVAVSYYYDSARNTYRIISVEGSKAIINSTITPNMAFTKTSQKFGQWSDPRANTVYGLGFGSESDLAKFIEKFKEVKELTRQQAAVQTQSPTTVNGTSDESHSASTTPRETPPNRSFFHTRSSSLTSMREPQPQNEQKENINLRERRNSFNTPGSNGTPNSSSPESQLKYENDRLKLALAQRHTVQPAASKTDESRRRQIRQLMSGARSANAKKWEIELQTLKNNNARLTAALQESTANVDEWKKQLAAYKDETGRMKKKIGDLEKKPGNTDQVTALQTEITQLNDRLESVQRDNHYKDEEVDRLQQRLAEMATRETANGNLRDKIKVDDVKALEEDNRQLQQKVHDLQQLLQDNKQSQENDKDEVLNLQDTLGSKITELYEFHEQIMATIRKESTS